MSRIIEGVILLSVSVLLVRYRYQFARSDIEFQNKTFHFNFGQKEIENSVRMGVVFAVLCALIGVVLIVTSING
jgi:uncharacterized membrane protein YqhA